MNGRVSENLLRRVAEDLRPDNRLVRILATPDVYVVMERRNPAACFNCGGHHPVYRYRRWLHDVWRIGRTYCACGYAQWPDLWRWNLLARLESEYGWLRLCWRYRRWVSRRAYFP